MSLATHRAPDRALSGDDDSENLPMLCYPGSSPDQDLERPGVR